MNLPLMVWEASGTLFTWHWLFRLCVS